MERSREEPCRRSFVDKAENLGDESGLLSPNASCAPRLAQVLAWKASTYEIGLWKAIDCADISDQGDFRETGMKDGLGGRIDLAQEHAVVPG